MAIKNQEALMKRANNLEDRGLNGFKLVLVTLYPDLNPIQAHLEVHFQNINVIESILSDSRDPHYIFPISGGHRLLAGPATEQVKVIRISENIIDTSLTLTVAPIGDYSTYTLSIDHLNIDPIFSEVNFKFRPGCFNFCAPEWERATEQNKDPVIDYLAKDYDSFKHTMIAAMMERVPGWAPTSEADLDQVLLEIFSAAADDLSDYQDRVMNEAYLGTARKRVSLARHARLMDYHIHQGNQASTWLAIMANEAPDISLGTGFLVWSGVHRDDPASVVFMNLEQRRLHHLLNGMSLYTWNDSIPSLAAGSTSADLLIDGEDAVATILNFIRSGVVTHFLIQEHLNPLTGREAGRDPHKRQLLQLLPGEMGAEMLRDPLTEVWMIRIFWEEKDKLKHNYCFTVDYPDRKVEDISLFHGNLVRVFHGQPIIATYKEPGALLVNPDEFYYERTERWGTICRLPTSLLAYQESPLGGEIPPTSTLQITVSVPGVFENSWDEVINLIHSDESDELGDRFIVETDEEGQSIIRFGNGINGKQLPDNAEVRCTYQIGRGSEGNIGADKLLHFDGSQIMECWNPFEVTNGKDPEPREEIIRRVPEAYRYRQLRAVTLKDYVNRAEELAEVSRASAKYVWTGSWRAVQIAIDPVGTSLLTDELRRKIASHLDTVRLIGDDLEIRPPRFVPLEIRVSLCIHPVYWPEDIRAILEQELSDGYTPDGRMAFFHPDRWTFGQELRSSQIIGRVQSVKGVDHVTSLTMKRWNEVSPGTNDVMEVRANEIIQVKNNRDHLEKGFIFINIKGGRR